jgi:adhesin transport system outer membrane protein
MPPVRRYVLVYIASVATGGFLFSATNTANVSSYTLSQAVQQTLATHPDVLSSEAKVQAARSDLTQAKGGWLPTIDVEGAGGREYSDNPATEAVGEDAITFTRTESNFLANQLIFDGGNVSYNIRQRSALYGASRYQLAQTEEVLAFNAAQAYLNVIRYRRLVTIAQAQVTENKKILEKINRRMEGGAGRISEVALAKGRVASAEAQLMQQQGLLNDAYSTFIRVVGMFPPEHLSMPSIPIAVPSDIVTAQVKANQISPAISAADSEYLASRDAVSVARSAYFPKINFALSASFSNNLDGVLGHNNDRMAMLRLTYNLFRGGSDVAAVDSANANKMAALHDAQSIRRQVNETVAQAWSDLQAAQRRLPFLKVHAVQSREVSEAYKKEFILGQRTLFDLLNAQSEYFSARSNYVSGVLDINVQEYRLYSAMGILVDVIHYGDEHPTAVKHKELPDAALPPLLSTTLDIATMEPSPTAAAAAAAAAVTSAASSLVTSIGGMTAPTSSTTTGATQPSAFVSAPTIGVSLPTAPSSQTAAQNAPHTATAQMPVSTSEVLIMPRIMKTEKPTSTPVHAPFLLTPTKPEVTAKMVTPTASSVAKPAAVHAPASPMIMKPASASKPAVSQVPATPMIMKPKETPAAAPHSPVITNPLTNPPAAAPQPPAPYTVPLDESSMNSQPEASRAVKTTKLASTKPATFMPKKVVLQKDQIATMKATQAAKLALATTPAAFTDNKSLQKEEVVSAHVTKATKLASTKPVTTLAENKSLKEKNVASVHVTKATKLAETKPSTILAKNKSLKEKDVTSAHATKATKLAVTKPTTTLAENKTLKKKDVASAHATKAAKSTSTETPLTIAMNKSSKRPQPSHSASAGASKQWQTLTDSALSK